jgi:hypothetical protein
MEKGKPQAGGQGLSGILSISMSKIPESIPDYALAG